MNFDYDSEQNDLREAVRGLLARAYSDSEQRRAVVKAEPGFDEKTWSRLAEMGLLGLPFAEEDGGMGAGPVEVAIVAEEIGRVLAPEPFIETVVLAGGLVAAVGTAEQKGELLGGISEGTTIAVFAHAEPGTRWSPSAEGVTATRTGDGWTLSGVKEPVPSGARADVLVVSAVV
ncbi:MAG: acyl-CoA dehydrogenase family protein, partial [Blastococcus sp.]